MSGSGTEQGVTHHSLSSSSDRDVEPSHHVADWPSTPPSTKLSKGKEREWTTIVERKRHRPLRLLDLPVDVLQEIIENLPHTNDLTSLALCHSVLHSLCIPQIYSRFDIVWPESQPNVEIRPGVDALTYGLATLVMADDAFGGALHQDRTMQQTRRMRDPYGNLVEMPAQPKRRCGNNYAQYTKKFSLGDGPGAWTSEYLITKECGKMLGTLVALAVARMRNLETFIWDMPTGVLRDVWLALASLADRNDGHDCRLERLWIRWHNNTLIGGSVPPPPPVMNLPVPLPPISSLPGAPGNITMPPLPQQMLAPPSQVSHSYMYLDYNVEHPTFSVLPPLKSLTVLDIDELTYLDEMSVLIGRSQHQLKELRVGIAKHAVTRNWASVWDGDGIHQVDHSTTWRAEPFVSAVGKGVGIPEKRLGGVLGVLVGRVFNLRNNEGSYAQSKGEDIPHDMAALERFQALAKQLGFEESNEKSSKITDLSIPPSSAESTSSSNSFLQSITKFIKQTTEEGSNDMNKTMDALREFYRAASKAGVADQLSLERSLLTKIAGPCLTNSLKLEVLELERVSISLQVVQKAIDWSTLTSLTLLNCQGHELLFKALRRNFTPTRSALASANSFTGTSTQSSSRACPHSQITTSSNAARSRFDYPLKITRIHCNTVTPTLLAFIRDTLAPNTLEVLFLQDSRTFNSTVPFTPIFAAIRRHARSLRKLLVDSSDRTPNNDPLPHIHANVANPPPPPPPAPPQQIPPAHQHGGGGGVVVQINVPGNQNVAVNQMPQLPPPIPPVGPAMQLGSQQFRRWLLPRRFLIFMTSGAMPNLREFGGCIGYRDWHLLLQRLPGLKGLRSLYVPYLADHPAGPGMDGRELAMQVLDVVALRPEVEIVFVGIANKCFEILEERTPVPQAPTSPSRDSTSTKNGKGSEGAVGSGQSTQSGGQSTSSSSAHQSVSIGDSPLGVFPGQSHVSGPSTPPAPQVSSDVSESDSDDDDNDPDTETEDDAAAIADDTEQELEIDPDALDDIGVDGLYLHRSDDDWDEFDDDWDYNEAKGRVRLRLREILYYDDKVAIFRARHAKL